jgi:DNA-binding Xre family transcriptional regulator
MQEIKNRKKIAVTLRKKVKEKKVKKTDIVKDTGLSRHTVYKLLQMGGRDENYSFDSLITMCQYLDLKIFII